MISFPSDVTITWCFIREEWFNLFPEFLVIRDKGGVQIFIEVFLDLSEKCDTKIPLFIIRLSRFNSF